MIRNSLIVVLGLVLTGCASDPEIPQPPAPLPPTQVELQIESDSNLNLDAAGKASPVMFRIYSLRDLSAFNGSDFFALLEKDQTALKNSLDNTQELLLKVGESKKITLTPKDDITGLSFFAAFRQLDNAQWRASAELQPHQIHRLTVRLNNNQVKIEKLEIEKPQPPEKPKED